MSGGVGSARVWAVRTLFLVFLAWCFVGFRKDFAQIELAPLLVDWPLIAAAGALSLLNYLLRVVRWDAYLKAAGHSLPPVFVAKTFMSGFAFTLSPGKLGEMVRVRYYRAHGVSVVKVSGAFFVERLLDLLAMIVLALCFIADLAEFRAFLFIAAALVAGLMAAIVFWPWQATSLWLADTRGRRFLRLRSAAKAAADIMVSARDFLRPGLFARGFVLGLLAWFLEAWGLQLISAMGGMQPLPLTTAMGIYAIAIIVGALSFLPGGLGSTEAVMAALLVQHGHAMPQAILLTLICRILTLWLAVAIGWACVWLLRREPILSP